MILLALTRFFSPTAFLNSKLLKSLDIPIFSSICLSLIIVSSGRMSTNLSNSFEILLRSDPKNSTNICDAFGSILYFLPLKTLRIQSET